MSKAVMQQALEALECHRTFIGSPDHTGTETTPLATTRAINALRTALAEPEPEPVETGDPQRAKELLKIFAGAPDTQLPERPLFATPPQRKPLTDERISDLWIWSATAEAERTASTQIHAFARAVERAHGIGGDA